MQKIIIITTFLVLVLISGQATSGEDLVINEASGIVRLGNDLLIVGDDDPGGYWKFPLQEAKGPAIKIVNPKRKALAKVQRATDLEAIDILADDRVVALSESALLLVGEKGIIAEYDDSSLCEFGNRGLEGLTIRHLKGKTSRVAVLWEGGYPEYKDVPEDQREKRGKVSMPPVVWIHDIEKDQSDVKVEMVNKEDLNLQTIELITPKPPGSEPEAQRFRAPDLVWHDLGEKGMGFIVLLSSENSPRPETNVKKQYAHMWLQRFFIKGDKGIPYGKPLDLKKEFDLKPKKANWEGLGWFEKGKSLIMIHDAKKPNATYGFVLDLQPHWGTDLQQ